MLSTFDLKSVKYFIVWRKKLQKKFCIYVINRANLFFEFSIFRGYTNGKPATLLKKRLPQLFSCKFYEFLRTPFTEHLCATASLPLWFDFLWEIQCNPFVSSLGKSKKKHALYFFSRHIPQKMQWKSRFLFTQKPVEYPSPGFCMI